MAHIHFTFKVRPQGAIPPQPRSELETFLHKLDLEYLHGILNEYEVDMDILPPMTEEDFRQLGISHGNSQSLWEAARLLG
jgi:hypothetical protein